MTHPRVDVLVVGAGPAGSVAARSLALRGHDVLLVDRDAHPRWKVCGACLSGRGLSALGAEGIEDLPETLGATRPRRLQLRHRSRRVDLPLEGTVVVSRGALDAALVERARGAGATVRVGWTATLGPEEDDLRSVELRRGDDVETIQAGVVLGATGLAPLPASTPGDRIERTVARRSRIGAGAVFAPGAFGHAGPDRDTVRMVVGEGGYVGMGTLEDGRLDLAAALDPAFVRTSGGLAPAVARVLDDAGHPAPLADPVEGWRGTPSLTRSAPTPGARRLLLVGDSASYVEPFTGEGMTWAIEDARAVVPFADAILRGTSPGAALAGWGRDRDARSRRSRRLIRAVAWLSRGAVRRHLAFMTLAAAPALARPFVRSAAAAPTRSDLRLRHDPA